MFLFNELVILSPLVLYAGFRIRKLIVPKLWKNAWTGFFILLVLAYPSAETLSHHSGKGGTKYLILAGYYCLPFLLYLVLIVLLTDLVLGAVRLLKLVSRETVRDSRFRIVRLWFLLAAPAVVVVLGVVNYNHLRIQDDSVEIPRKSSGIRQLKIAFAADLHLSDLTAERLMERFVDKVNALDPDIVLIGGDVLEGDRRDEKTSEFETQFRRIKSKYGVFAVPGNHESHRGSQGDFFVKAGIRLLQDAVEKIDGAFYLAGRKDGRSRNRKSIEELLGGTPDDLPVILMDHRPTDMDRVSRSRVDIQLSGHTHNGQLFPINFITRKQYGLSWGAMKKNRTYFFVTSGLQLWGPPVRTAGASEILSIHVVFRD